MANLHTQLPVGVTSDGSSPSPIRKRPDAFPTLGVRFRVGATTAAGAGAGVGTDTAAAFVFAAGGFFHAFTSGAVVGW
jgi:hypothetical protein